MIKTLNLLLIEDNKTDCAKFENYISKMQKSTMQEMGIQGYDDCLDKLKHAYSKLNHSLDSEVDKIITLATTGKIDINQYLPGNKVREGAFNSLLGNDFDITGKSNSSSVKICL